MDRRYIEIDLPSRVADYLAPNIDAWLDRAKAGDRLRVSVTADVTAPAALAHPAVIVNNQARDELDLQLVDLNGTQRPYFLLKPMTKADERLVDALERRLNPAPTLDQVLEDIDKGIKATVEAQYGFAGGFRC